MNLGEFTKQLKEVSTLPGIKVQLLDTGCHQHFKVTEMRLDDNTLVVEMVHQSPEEAEAE